LIQLTSAQQTILAVVSRYTGQFSRSGLAKMLVGARSWQDTSLSEYGRKNLTFDIEVLMQQFYLRLDDRQHLVSAASSGGVGKSGNRCSC
jgi:hypothetical protein